MPKGKRVSVEQVIKTLRDIEIYHAQGHTIAESCRHNGITEQTYYRWRERRFMISGGRQTADSASHLMPF